VSADGDGVAWSGDCCSALPHADTPNARTVVAATAVMIRFMMFPKISVLGRYLDRLASDWIRRLAFRTFRDPDVHCAKLFKSHRNPGPSTTAFFTEAGPECRASWTSVRTRISDVIGNTSPVRSFAIRSSQMRTRSR